MGYQARKVIPCVVCGVPAIGRKLCRPHYYRMKKNGTLADYPTISVDDVFDDRYVKTLGGCWEWKGTKNEYGYGIFLLPGEKSSRAHRVMYERVNGPIPNNLVVMHICDNPSCVNPDHLRLGTKADNNKDRIEKRRGKYNMDRKGCRLTVEQVKDIIVDERKQKDIADSYGVNPSHISRIKRGLARKYI